jgi:2-pyrone-4,6-dicarboxylate lactonase
VTNAPGPTASAGPDPNPVKPLYAMPQGACDCHCHVFGPASRFPYAPERTYTPDDAPFERLRALHDHLGITRAIVVQPTCHGVDHAVTIDAIARSNGRYLGIANGAADFDDSELMKLHEAGMRGVRFNFVRHLGAVPDEARFLAMMKRIAPLGWHVELHLDAEDLLERERLFDNVNIPLVIDHMGRAKAAAGINQPAFRALLKLLCANPLAWVKISGADRLAGKAPLNDAIPFARALIEAAPNRVLWGTDWPHPNVSANMPNDGELVNLFFRIVDDAALQRQILVSNPQLLYGFV